VAQPTDKKPTKRIRAKPLYRYLFLKIVLSPWVTVLTFYMQVYRYL
jgi:hypothetical protein